MLCQVIQSTWITLNWKSLSRAVCVHICVNSCVCQQLSPLTPLDIYYSHAESVAEAPIFIFPWGCSSKKVCACVCACLCVTTLLLHCLFSLTGSVLICLSVSHWCSSREEGHDSARNCECVTACMCNQIHRNHLSSPFNQSLIPLTFTVTCTHTYSRPKQTYCMWTKLGKKSSSLLLHLLTAPTNRVYEALRHTETSLSLSPSGYFLVTACDEDSLQTASARKHCTV